MLHKFRDVSLKIFGLRANCHLHGFLLFPRNQDILQLIYNEYSILNMRLNSSSIVIIRDLRVFFNDKLWERIFYN